MMYGSDTPVAAAAPDVSRLQLSPNEQELMDLKQRISANLEEVRHSVGAIQLQYIELVQRDMARAHELLHALIVTESKNKVNIYKRQLSRLHKTLDEILGSEFILEAPPSSSSCTVLPPAPARGHDGILQYTTDSVYNCAWSIDGTKIASACGDDLVRVTDVATGDLIWALEGHKDDVFSVCFSDDGSRLVSASKDRTVRLWDLINGVCLMVFTGHTMTVLSAVFLDDDTIISVSQDTTLRKWDVRSGKCTMAVKPDGHPLLCCAISPDGKIVATSSTEGTICFIDIRKGILLRSIRGHKKAIWNVNFSINGKMLSSCGEDSGVRIWDTENGTLIRSLGESGICIYSSSFSNSMKMIASASVDKTVRIWNLETGSLIRTITGHKSWTFHCAFSPDDRFILSSSEDRTVRLWRSDTGEACTSEMIEMASAVRPRMESAEPSPTTRDSRSAHMSKSSQALFDDIRANVCPEHCLPLSFYCVEERKFLCEACMKVHDDSHHTTDGLGLSKMAERALQDVMITFMHSLHGTEETLETHMNILAESRIAARRKVELTMNTLLEAVLTRRKQLLKQVDLAYDQALVSLRDQHDNYLRDVISRMSSFASEANAGVLCDTYLSADSRFTETKPPLALQPTQVCYFGNTSSQGIAAEIYRMGNVAINTAPPSSFEGNQVLLQKPQPQAPQMLPPQQQPQFVTKAHKNYPPVITMAGPSSNSNVSFPPPQNVQVSKLTPNVGENPPRPTQTREISDGSSPVARSTSEPLQNVPPASLESDDNNDDADDDDAEEDESARHTVR